MRDRSITMCYAAVIFACLSISCAPESSLIPYNSVASNSAALRHGVTQKRVVSEFRLSFDDYNKKKAHNIVKLRTRMLGCQEWSANGDGKVTISFVRADGVQLERERDPELQFVTAKVRYEHDTVYTSVLCMLPKSVSPMIYLEQLQRGRLPRGGANSLDIVQMSLRNSSSHAVAAILSDTRLFEPPSVAATVQSDGMASTYTLPVIIVVASEWAFAGWNDPYGSPDPWDWQGNYGDAEEQMLEYQDPDYCGSSECWEPAGEDCPNSIRLAAGQVLDSIANAKPYCNTVSPSTDKLCFDFWIQKCEAITGVQGDCRDGSSSDRARFRARFVLNLATGILEDSVISPSCMTSGTCYPPLSGNRLYAYKLPFFTDSYRVVGELKNSIPFLSWISPDIDFQITIMRDGANLSVNLIADGFPTMGIWRGEIGGWGAGRVFLEGDPWQLFGVGDRRCLFTL